LEHAIAVEIQFESGNVRDNWTRKPYGWNGIELGTRRVLINSQMETGNGLTSGSLLKYWANKRKSTTKNPARKDALRSNSSAMVQRREGRVGSSGVESS
jgi:hypothetical protein